MPWNISIVIQRKGRQYFLLAKRHAPSFTNLSFQLRSGHKLNQETLMAGPTFWKRKQYTHLFLRKKILEGALHELD